MKNIESKIHEFKMLLTEGDCEKAADLLISIALEHDKKIADDLLLLKERINRIKAEQIKNIISYDIYSIEISKINDSLLYICNQINTARENNSNVKKKNGKLLYDIPNLMPLGLETKCIIRIGNENVDLFEDLVNNENIKIEDIKVSKIMDIALVDLNNGEDFEVRALNNSEQYLEEDEFSQWIFFVKAKSAGTHTLFLKVSTIQLIDNKERKREIVLEKNISVVTPSEANDLVRSWTDSNILINKDKPKNKSWMIYSRWSYTVILLILSISAVAALSIRYFRHNKQDLPNNTTKSQSILKDSVSSKKSDSIIADSLVNGLESTSNVKNEDSKRLKTLESKKIKDKDQIKNQTISESKDSKIEPIEDIKMPKNDDNQSNNIYAKGMKIDDSVQPKDTVLFGSTILLTIMTTGIKNGELVILTPKGNRLKPTSIDGNTFYFDIKATNGSFNLRVMDNETKLFKDRSFDGNTNCIWRVKRVATGKISIGVD